MNVFFGIDNGVTGSVGALVRGEGEAEDIFMSVPHRSEQSYTKKKQQVGRIDWQALTDFLRDASEGRRAFCMIERPMIAPVRFKASISGARALEAVQICCEMVGVSIQFVDSREWQKVLLPSGLKGEDLKDASTEIGCRLFPLLTEKIVKHKDADGLLIAEYCRRMFG